MSPTSTPSTERPWWLEPGPERCTHCGRSHHLEVSIRCMACDEPICPLCVVTIREVGGESCPSCAKEDED